MNILIITYNMNPPWADGVINSLRLFVTLAHRNGYGVTVWTTRDKKLRDTEDCEGIYYERFCSVANASSNQKIPAFDLFRFLISAAIKMVKEDKRYDFIITNIGLTPYKLFFRKLFSRYGKVIEMVLQYPKRHKIFYFLPDRLYYRFFLSWAYKLACPAKDIFIYLKGFSKNAVYFPIGIDTSLFSPDNDKKERTRISLGLKDNDVILFYFGHFFRGKGVRLLTDAFRGLSEKYENVKLLLGYSGQNEHYAENSPSLITKLFPGRVISLGYRQDIANILNCIDIFIFPILDKSHVACLPLTILEAMACEKAVVVSRLDSTVSIIEDFRNGLLFEPGNSKSLFDKTSLLIEDAGLRKRIGSKAREKILSEYSTSRMDTYLPELLL